MSLFRDTISPNDFKNAVFAGDDFCETLTFRRYPKRQARAVGTATGSTITGITISDGGEGYGSTPTYTVSGTTGATLVLDTITITDGVITAITIDSSSSNWTGQATIQFFNGYEDESVEAVVVREGVQKVNGRINIYDALRISVSKLDLPTIDTGTDCFLVKRKMDQTAQEMKITNIITQNSALWIVACK